MNDQELIEVWDADTKTRSNYLKLEIEEKSRLFDLLQERLYKLNGWEIGER